MAPAGLTSLAAGDLPSVLLPSSCLRPGTAGGYSTGWRGRDALPSTPQPRLPHTPIQRRKRSKLTCYQGGSVAAGTLFFAVVAGVLGLNIVNRKSTRWRHGRYGGAFAKTRKAARHRVSLHLGNNRASILAVWHM